MSEDRGSGLTVAGPHGTFPPEVIARVHEMAETGHYPIRGLGARRRVPTFDDLTFLTASMSRYPLEGYRERCDTRTVLGAAHGARPLELSIPITIAGMSFGALSASAKEALGRAASEVGTSTTTGDGGMTPEERKASSLLVYQVLPSRYGFDPADLRQADAVEIVIGQGAKPGGGGLLLGQKVNERVAAMRTLPPGIDQRSASRHPDWVGPDDLRIKIEELREATDWAVPVYVKVGATRVDHDVMLAVAAGADVVVVDGMQGGTAATQDVFIEHTGIPTMPAVRMAAEALEKAGARGTVQLIVSGGIRSGADVAKALALGADAVSIGVAALLALGCNRSSYRRPDAIAVDVRDEYVALGTTAGHCAHCHTGRCPVGIATQDPELEARLDAETAATSVANYLRAVTMEVAALTRACGKSDVHHLEPEDLVALTIEAAAMAQVPLAGTRWIPGQSGDAR
jgi:methylamine---glutamate N-methyltransferase subunit C